LSQNSKYLEEWIDSLKVEDLHKNHPDYIGLVGLMFYTVYKGRLGIFKKAFGAWYRVAYENEAFLKYAQNFIVVILRIIEDKVPLQKRNAL